MRAAIALGFLVACGGGVDLKGSWDCENNGKKRPTFTFSANVVGKKIKKVTATPLYEGVVGVGEVKLKEKRKGQGRYEYAGPLPETTEFEFDFGGESVKWKESCNDIDAVVFTVTKENGERFDFEK